MSSSVDFLAAIERESHRFRACLAAADPTAPVPTCPGWDAADLLWHLTEVQLFWGAIVRGRLTEPNSAKAARPVRPREFADLLALQERATAELVDGLAGCDPETAMWTWSDDQTAGFVLRRQAHEALIHRLDAESVVDSSSLIDADLAADGIDEALRVMYGEVPEWGSFTAANIVGVVTATDVERSWGVTLGRFVGTDPGSATTYDEEALRVVDTTTDVATTNDARFEVRATAATLDTWLWNRPLVEQIEVLGDALASARFEEIIRRGVQ